VENICNSYPLGSFYFKLHTPPLRGAARRAEDVGGDPRGCSAEHRRSGRRSGRGGRRCTPREIPLWAVAFYPAHGRARPPPPPPPPPVFFGEAFFSPPQKAKKGRPGARRAHRAGPAWRHVHATAGSTRRHHARRYIRPRRAPRAHPAAGAAAAGHLGRPKWATGRRSRPGEAAGRQGGARDGSQGTPDTVAVSNVSGYDSESDLPRETGMSWFKYVTLCTCARL